MKLFTESDNKTSKMVFNGTAKELLDQLKINPVTVIVIKNDELITLDEKLTDKDFVRILEVISGG